jgi:hypothetical protein
MLRSGLRLKSIQTVCEATGQIGDAEVQGKAVVDVTGEEVQDSNLAMSKPVQMLTFLLPALKVLLSSVKKRLSERLLLI